MQNIVNQFLENYRRVKPVECGSVRNEDSNYYLLNDNHGKYFSVIEHLPAPEYETLTEDILNIADENIGVDIKYVYRPISSNGKNKEAFTEKLKLIDFVYRTPEPHAVDYLFFEVENYILSPRD